MEQGTQQQSTSKDESTVLLSLEEMIKSNVNRLTKLKEEKKEKADMLKSAYLSDAVYHDLDEKAKDARKQATELKGQLLQMPSNKLLSAEVKDMALEIKEVQLALSDYLLEYKRMTGATQLELFPGEFGEIVVSARIRKVTSKKN